MTILEVERRTGLERTNIRFYERENLVVPVRQENGYRDYSEEDVALLLKIKLLRRLGFSLDDIRGLKDGVTGMDEAIEKRIKEIAAKHQQLNAAETVCREMKEERVSFAGLNAEKYLSSYDRALRPAQNSAPVIAQNVPKTDRIYPERIPFRRFFARNFDLYLMTSVIYAVLALGFHVNISRIPQFVDLILTLGCWGLLLPIEAVFLSRLGTTPGKWLLGIRVEHYTGRKLTYKEALERAVGVLLKGQGLTIPVYQLVRNYKCYKLLSEGEDLPWDYESSVTSVEMKNRHLVRYLGANALLVVATILAILSPAMPKHRGDLTVEQFVENYNQLARFHYGYDVNRLELDGSFSEPPTYTDGTVIIRIEESSTLPEAEPLRLEFTEENGILTGVSFTRKMPYYIMYTGNYNCTVAIQISSMAFSWGDISIPEMIFTEKKLEPFLQSQVGELSESFWGCNFEYSLEPIYSDIVGNESEECEIFFSLTKAE